MIIATPIQMVNLPTATFTRLPLPLDQNKLELQNVEFWQLKKHLKTLQTGLYSVFLNVPIKYVQENEKRNLIVKEK